MYKYLFFLFCLIATITATDTDYVSDQPSSEQLIQSVPDTPAQPILDAIQSLTDAYNGKIVVSVNSGTQVVDSVEILDNGDVNGRRLLQALTPEEKALLWFQQHGAIFGMAVNEYNGLQLVSNNLDNTTGHVHLIYEQYVDDVPVFGGRMNVHFDSQINIASVNGNYIREFAPVNTTASLPVDEVVVIAKRFLTKFKYDNLNETETETFDERMARLQLYTDPELMIYRYGILQNVPGSSVLTYRVVLFSTRIRHIIFVNAHTGDIVEEFQDKHEVLNRVVQRYDKTLARYVTVWTEGQAPTGNAAYDSLSQIAGHSYNFFGSITKGAWKSFNGGDAQMLSVLDTDGALMSCPNAMFDGDKSVFCSGTVADDVVAHEWGHGYTGYTSGLVYKYQQGAMNEAFSDMWGETIDLLNGVGTDTPSSVRSAAGCVDWRTNVRWQVGEDATSFGSPIRDMWNPECRAHPSRVLSTYYRCSTSDSGGVHSNSGVVNRFYSLLVDGGTFNGQTVTGIGLQKAAHLMWQVSRYYLTSVSAFPALASSLPSACRDLTGAALPNIVFTGASTWSNAGVGASITASDCQQVDKASQAVELRLQPNCNFGYVINPAPFPLCPVSTQINYDLLFDDFEHRNLAGAGWTTTSVGVTGAWNRRTWTVNGVSDGRDGYGAYASNTNVGDCNANDQSGVVRLVSKPITVPAGAGSIRVSFEHYYATEDKYDGGNVQIEINGAQPVVVPKAAFLYNGYPYVLATTTPGYNTNPMRGQEAYTGAASSGGPQGVWARSVIDLSQLVKVGDTFKLSFQFGSDGCSGVVGWYVDDIRVYWCGQDYCALSPCFNSGTCTNNPATQSRTCACPSGFGGADCSVIATPQRTYSWVTGAFSTCSVTCNSGISTRTVQCRDDLGAFVADSFCLTATPNVLKPATQQSCNTQACPASYSWRYAEYSGCSVTCGSGVETRTAQCISSQGSVVVDDSFCAALTKESLTRTCTLNPCPVYVWSYGAWGACSRTCGPGFRTRSVTCVDQTTQVPTTADQCAGQTVQATSEACNVRPCATWVYSEWSTCSVPCGGGQQTRTATCTNADATPQADVIECGARDILTRSCNPEACLTYAWRYSGWGECSAPCDGGSQSRTSSCIGSNGIITTNTALCGAQDILTRSCNTQSCRTYQWVYSEWSACSADCGVGFRSRTLSCRDDTGAPAWNSLCASSSPTAPLSERCNTQPCSTYSYQYGEWTSCPVQCGGATQTRTVQCKDSNGATADMSLCSGTIEETSRPCNTNPCNTYNWVYSNWGTCSAPCGGGMETRTAECRGNDGSVAESEALCTAEKESLARSCGTGICVTYEWQYSDWSDCSAQCGEGTRSRTARCIISSTGEAAADVLCTDAQLPLSESCTGTNCPVAVSWYVTPWTTCDVTCGGGLARRSVFCVISGSFQLVSEELCTATAPKPDTTQPCNTTPCSGVTYRWYTFAWGRCSANCNGGLQTRSVVCIDARYRIYSNSFCDPATKPETSQACNTSPCSRRWKTTSWSACSAECGGTGVQTRTVECIDETTSSSLSEADCVGIGEKPTDTQACNTELCPEWRAEQWGACSRNCGSGVQTRPAAKCFDYSGVEVDASRCTAAAPETQRSCNTQTCPSFSWRVLDWSACSTTCGGGVSTRPVRCFKSNGQLWPEIYCSIEQAGPRPESQQVCNTQACSNNSAYTGIWWNSGWYRCTNGVQYRDAVCMNTGYYQIADQFCDPTTRPSGSQSC